MEFTFKATDSEAIGQVWYSNETKVLTVRFTSGATYHYLKVPQDTYNKFAKADSAGQFFYEHIRSHFTGHKE